MAELIDQLVVLAGGVTLNSKSQLPDHPAQHKGISASKVGM